jgi:hypothetical protein
MGGMRGLSFQREAQPLHHGPRGDVLGLIDADDLLEAELLEPVANSCAVSAISTADTAMPGSWYRSIVRSRNDSVSALDQPRPNGYHQNDSSA